jgi:hypothetical protein
MPPPSLPKKLPPNLPTLPTKIKRVIAWWIAVLITEDGGCSLSYVKVTNLGAIKMAGKSLCCQLGAKNRFVIKKLTKLASSTLCIQIEIKKHAQ